MARRVQRTWAPLISSTMSVGPAATPGTVVMIQDDGASVGQGIVRIARVIGCVTVAVTNAVIGDPNLHLWHGAISMDFDGAVTSVFPVPGDGDENQENWLWREPIPIWNTQFGQNASIDDFILSWRFDWQFRGGKGSQIRPHSKTVYVIDTNGAAAVGVQANVRGIILFSGT